MRYVYLFLFFPFFLTGQSVLIPHQQGDLWGYIDIESEEVIVPYQYEEAREHDPYGYAMVRKNNYWGILDADGKELLELKYDSLEWQGTAYYDIYRTPYLLTQLNGLFGVMDIEFNEIIPNNYEEIKFFKGRFFKKNPIKDYTKLDRSSIPRYFKVRKNGKIGLVDEAHQLVVPFEFDDIKAVSQYKINYSYDPNKNPFHIVSHIQNHQPYNIRLISDTIFFAKKDNLSQLIKIGGKALSPIGNYEHPIIHIFVSSEKEDEVIFISKDKKRGMLSMEGDVLIPFEYLQIEQLIGSYLKLTKKYEGSESQIHSYGIANVEGEIIQAPIYSHLDGQLVHLDGQSGILTKDFKDFFIKPQYQYISPIRKNHTKVMVNQNGKRGILDIEKGIVVPIEYDYLVENSSLNYIAKKDGKSGIIDTNNNVILPFQYESISTLQGNPYGLIVQKDKQFRLIDSRTKEWLSGPQYDLINASHANKIHVQLNGKWGKISSNNKILIPIEYDEITPTNQVKKGDKWGLYDRNNKLLLKPIYDEIKSKNFARIDNTWYLITDTKSWPLAEKYDNLYGSHNKYYTQKDKKKGLILINDSLCTIPPQFESIGYGRSSDYVTAKKDGKWGIVDINNNIVFPFIYERIEKLHKDRWKVYDGEHWAFYDLNGKQILPFIFSDISEVYNRPYYMNEDRPLYHVKQQHRSGIISKDGEWIFPCQYQSINFSYFNNDISKNPPLYPIQQKGKWAYIREGGEIVLPFQYTTATPFNNNIAIVSKDSNYFLINDTGEQITKNSYKSIAPLHAETTLINVQSEAGLHGAINKNGEEVIPLIFDMPPEEYCTHFYTVVKNGLYGTIHSSGRTIKECSLKEKPAPVNRRTIHHRRERNNPFDFQVWHKFYKNYYYVKKGDYLGVIDIETNILVIPCQYNRLYRSRGKNPMTLLKATKDKKKGVIDSTGKIIIPIKYDQISIDQKINRISCKENDKFKIFDLQGRLITEFFFDNFYYHGPGPYLAQKDDKWGYVDINGKTVIPFLFDKARGFVDLYFNKEDYFECPMLAKNSPLPVDTIKAAQVFIGDKKKYINQNGDYLDPNFSSMDRFYINSELIGIKQDSSKKYGIVDTAGNIILPFEYEDMYPENAHFVYLEKGDSEGYFYVANRKSSMHESIEDEEDYDHQWVQNGSYFGFVNKFGTMMSPMHFEFIKRTEKNLIVVSKAGKVGFLNNDLKEVIPFNYDAIPCSNKRYGFKLGNSLAFKNNKYGIINTKGETIIPFEYDSIQYYDHYQAMGLKDGEWKVIEIKLN